MTRDLEVNGDGEGGPWIFECSRYRCIVRGVPTIAEAKRMLPLRTLFSWRLLKGER